MEECWAIIICYRSQVAVAAVDDNGIVVIGGCTKGGNGAELNVGHPL